MNPIMLNKNTARQVENNNLSALYVDEGKVRM
nr:MAG TPA: hypothetical protein [Bacteriophage sp.]